jgi:hypothetical protein
MRPGHGWQSFSKLNFYFNINCLKSGTHPPHPSGTLGSLANDPACSGSEAGAIAAPAARAVAVNGSPARDARGIALGSIAYVAGEARRAAIAERD